MCAAAGCKKHSGSDVSVSVVVHPVTLGRTGRPRIVVKVIPEVQTRSVYAVGTAQHVKALPSAASESVPILGASDDVALPEPIEIDGPAADGYRLVCPTLTFKRDPVISARRV